MLILAFAYVRARLPFVYATAIGAAMIVYYNAISIWFIDDAPLDVWFADHLLVGFAIAGMAAAYGLERGARLLYLRERQLDAERQRSDDLLRNALPQAIVDRLNALPGESQAPLIADGLSEVSVLFADLVGSTGHAGATLPGELVTILDDVFRRFDAVAAELGMEKIKTVGDAYMAVAHGAPMQVRVGIASGPAVAGVIGREGFAYDLWGDTVNLASRLESHGEPGRILVSEATAAALDGYALDGPHRVDLKGKGPTPAWFLLGRA